MKKTCFPLLLALLLLTGCTGPIEAPEETSAETVPPAEETTNAPKEETAVPTAEPQAQPTGPAEPTPSLLTGQWPGGYIPGLVEHGDELAQYDIYLVGETHATTGTYTAQLHLLQYAYHELGVRHLLLEAGFGSGRLVNDYVNGGDTELFQAYFTALKGSFAYTQEHFALFENIRQFNLGLPEDERLTVWGVDVEHQPSNSKRYLSALAASTDMPEEMQLALAGRSGKAAWEALLENIDDYSGYLGEQFYDFSMTVEGILQGYRFKEWPASSVREVFFTDNALSVLTEIGRERVLCFFGAWHTDLSAHSSGRYDHVTVGEALAEAYGRGPGGVASIRLTYLSGEVLGSDGSVWDIDNSEAEILAERTDWDICLFPLSAEDESPELRALARGQQYALLIRDSPATTGYSG